MVVPAASIRQTGRLLNQSLKAARSSARSRSWRYVQRRAYAGGGDHGHQQAGGDLPWAIASVTVTLPCLWYLWPRSKKGHGHEHGHDEQKGHQGGDKTSEHGDATANSESGKGAGEDVMDKQQANSDEKSDESDSQEEGHPNTPDATDDQSDDIPHEKEGGADVEGVRFKGPAKGIAEGVQGDTRKHIPDAKGYNKKRVESDYGEPQGVAHDDDTTVQEPGNAKDKPAASKTPGSMGVQSGKQEGLSNADTKHSTDIAGDPEKSTKPGGDPETAKSKGTVDPRPQQ